MTSPSFTCIVYVQTLKVKVMHVAIWESYGGGHFISCIKVHVIRGDRASQTTKEVGSYIYMYHSIHIKNIYKHCFVTANGESNNVTTVTMTTWALLPSL